MESLNVDLTGAQWWLGRGRCLDYNSCFFGSGFPFGQSDHFVHVRVDYTEILSEKETMKEVRLSKVRSKSLVESIFSGYED